MTQDHWCWSWNSNTLVTWCEELTHWKRPWCREGLKVREGDDRGWDGWMASPTRWTWVWINSGSRWGTGRPGVRRAAVHGVAKSGIQLSDWTELRSEQKHDTRDLTFYQYVKGLYLLISNSAFSSILLLLLSCSVMSDSLQPHGLQRSRSSCPSQSPGAYSNSCPLSRWCHPTMLPSVVPFSSCPQSFPASRFFSKSALFSLIKKLLHFGVLPVYIFHYFTFNVLYLYKYMPYKCFALLFHLPTLSLN